MVTELQNALASAGRIFDFLDEETVSPEVPEAVVLKETRGKVEFSHVDFSYVPEVPLIRDLNLLANPGQRNPRCRPHRLRKDDADQSADAIL